jgi:hypothetical protein
MMTCSFVRLKFKMNQVTRSRRLRISWLLKDLLLRLSRPLLISATWRVFYNKMRPLTSRRLRQTSRSQTDEGGQFLQLFTLLHSSITFAIRKVQRQIVGHGYGDKPHSRANTDIIFFFYNFFLFLLFFIFFFVFLVFLISFYIFYIFFCIFSIFYIFFGIFYIIFLKLLISFLYFYYIFNIFYIFFL